MRRRNPRHKPSIDVAITGAGAAGLAAGRDVHAAGNSVLLLEARHRVGGRVFTIRPRRSALPIESGAEFVHARADDVTRIAKAAALPVLEIDGLRVERRGTKLRRRDDFWERLDTVMRRVPKGHETDLSFADFLKGEPGGRTLARNRRSPDPGADSDRDPGCRRRLARFAPRAADDHVGLAPASHGCHRDRIRRCAAGVGGKYSCV